MSVKALREINRNFPHDPEYQEESFTGILHELGRWDEEAYQKLEAALVELSRQYQHASDLPRGLVWRIMNIFGDIMMSIRCHFDPNDGYRIENIFNDQLREKEDRFRYVVESFFEGRVPDLSLFDEEPDERL